MLWIDSFEGLIMTHLKHAVGYVSHTLIAEKAMLLTISLYTNIIYVSSMGIKLKFIGTETYN